jgi:hypothetical protein
LTSSETAQGVRLALWFVATLLLTSAQLRVVPAARPRYRRYVFAWFGCTLIGGALLSLMDTVVGQTDWTRRLANAAIAASVSAVGLGAGAWLTQRLEWTRMQRGARFLTLVLLHALVILIVAYPFI